MEGLPRPARPAGSQATVGEPKVAARAGHSIAVLYRFYAKILKGGQQQSNSLIARALDEGEWP
ncbi:hypothetical protein AQJ43_21000 [Streptomyces avermitilis]|nr:hypothetical protein AQJ43_21000 [Streptomyces avermitilis]OOV33592.1 hypothetical protein SM007_03420 [Streptomyces avermitilis]